MAENKIVKDKAIGNRTQRDRAENRRVQTSREKFEGYDSSQWEHTYFDENSNGFVVTEKERITEGNKSKKNKEIFDNEQNTCRKFASFGFQIEHLSEPHNAKAPDARVVRGTHSIIVVNGKRAEIKQLKSSNNIINQAKDAFRNKKAKLMIYEFTQHAPGIKERIGELVRKYHIHGYYYFSDENRYYEF